MAIDKKYPAFTPEDPVLFDDEIIGWRPSASDSEANIRLTVPTLARALGVYPTVGPNGQYATVLAAVTAGAFKMQFIGTVIESADITIPTNQDVFILMEGYSWLIEDATIVCNGITQLKFAGSGRIVTALTTASKKTFDLNGASILHLTGLRFFDASPNGGTNTGIATFETGCLLIADNVNFSLPDGAFGGFDNLPAGSHMTNFTVSGSGSSCSGFITNGHQCIISNGTFSGTFNTSQSSPIIEIDATAQIIGIISNLNRTGSGVLWIAIEGLGGVLSNFSTNLAIDMKASNNCSLSGGILDSLDVSDAGCDTNSFVNLTVGNPVNFGGNNNVGTACRFLSSLTLSGSDNNFSVTALPSGVFTSTGSNNNVTSLAAAHPISTKSGTSYTLRSSDLNSIIQPNNANPFTLTLPQNSTENLSIGFTCTVIQLAAGLVTFAVQGGDTLRALSGVVTLGANSSVSVRKLASGVWWIYGDLT